MVSFCHKWLALDRLLLSILNEWSLTHINGLIIFIHSYIFAFLNKCIPRDFLNNNGQLIQFWNANFRVDILLLPSLDFFSLDKNSSDIRKRVSYRYFSCCKSTKYGTLSYVTLQALTLGTLTRADLKVAWKCKNWLTKQLIAITLCSIWGAGIVCMLEVETSRHCTYFSKHSYTEWILIFTYQQKVGIDYCWPQSVWRTLWRGLGKAFWFRLIETIFKLKVRIFT